MKLHLSSSPSSLDLHPSTSHCFTFLSSSLQLNSFNPIKLSCFVISAARLLEPDLSMVKQHRSWHSLADHGAGSSVGHTGSHVGLLEEAEHLRSCLASFPRSEFFLAQSDGILWSFTVIPVLCVCVCVLVVRCVPWPGCKLCGWAQPERGGKTFLTVYRGRFGEGVFWRGLIALCLTCESTVKG